MSLDPEQIIFLVDDEPSLRKALRVSLESLGVKVICFENPALCLESLKEEHCDLLITDKNMPVMDGISLLKEVKECFPSLPVVVMTGCGDVTTAVQCMKLGAQDYIEKPLDEEIILPKVAAILRQNRTIKYQDLSDAERQVVSLIADGRSNKEIAHILDRSVRTVENHRHRIMKKMKVTSTAELIAAVVKAEIK